MILKFSCVSTVVVAVLTSRPTTAAADETANPEDFLSPVLPWHEASEALLANHDDPWITPSEETDLTDTPNYEKTIAHLKRLAAASPMIRLQEFGRTSEGRLLYVVIATQDKSCTPQALRASGKPILLAQAGIHAGEIDGKDAGLMLLRDIALRGKASLLDRAHFLFVPVFNADGHERASEWNRPNQRGPIHQGWRTTAQNRNLNRDYMKADTPEIRAMLNLLNEWGPKLYLDLHVTDGSDYQYDITFGYNGDPGTFSWSPEIADWLNRFYRPTVEAALTAAGHFPGPLVFPIDDRDPTKGLNAGPAMPRYSNGYGDLRHLPTVLVENHSLRPYRQRVLGTCVLLEASLRTLGEQAESLRQAIASDSARRPARIPFNWGSHDGPRTNRSFHGINFETYQSPASGGTEVRWLGVPRFYTNLPVQLDRAGIELIRPRAYWVPATAPDVIDRLKIHGIHLETASAAQTVSVQVYRLVHPQIMSKARAEELPVFEGRFLLRTEVKPERRTQTFPPGSVRVSTDQPLGDLVVAMLEPESHDSLFAWGFFPEVLQRTEYIEGYVMAPMAERMLAQDPGLKAEFEAKLKAEPKFAADPAARLQWFYERSRFYDERYLLYPVGIERDSKP
jgi:hypothetical protein